MDLAPLLRLSTALCEVDEAAKELQAQERHPSVTLDATQRLMVANIRQTAAALLRSLAASAEGARE